MRRTMRVPGILCLAGWTCIGSIGCGSEEDAEQGAIETQLFENKIDPLKVAGDVADHTGDLIPDLFMVINQENGTAAALLTTDRGGQTRLLGRVLDQGQPATPEEALQGITVGTGDLDGLIHRFEGL